MRKAPPQIHTALRKRPHLAGDGLSILFDGAVIIGIQPTDHEAGVAAARAHASIARVGNHHIAPVSLPGEASRRATDQARAHNQKVNFALLLLRPLPV